MQRRIAKMQIEVDQADPLVLGGNRKRQVGRQKGRAAAALAGHEGEHLARHRWRAVPGNAFADTAHRLLQGAGIERRLDHLAHADAHRREQKARLLLGANQHHRHCRVALHDRLQPGQFLLATALRFKQQQTGQLLLDHRPEMRCAGRPDLQLNGAILGGEIVAQVFQGFGIARQHAHLQGVTARPAMAGLRSSRFH